MSTKFKKPIHKKEEAKPVLRVKPKEEEKIVELPKTPKVEPIKEEPKAPILKKDVTQEVVLLLKEVESILLPELQINSRIAFKKIDEKVKEALELLK